MQEKPLILLADDSSDDCRIIQMALKQIAIPCALKTVPDGEALIQALKNGLRPDLCLVDLNLPLKSGLEALQEIKADPALRSLPVIVWSTSENPVEILQSYQYGSSTFFTKPDSFDQIVETMRVVTEYWFRVAKLPPQNGIS